MENYEDNRNSDRAWSGFPFLYTLVLLNFKNNSYVISIVEES